MTHRETRPLLAVELKTAEPRWRPSHNRTRSGLIHLCLILAVSTAGCTDVDKYGDYREIFAEAKFAKFYPGEPSQTLQSDCGGSASAWIAAMKGFPTMAEGRTRATTPRQGRQGTIAFYDAKRVLVGYRPVWVSSGVEGIHFIDPTGIRELLGGDYGCGVPPDKRSEIAAALADCDITSVSDSTKE